MPKVDKFSKQYEDLEENEKFKGVMVYEKEAKIDKKDIEILRILERNSRLPVSEIARKVKLSRDLVVYRIKRMIEKKIIIRFTALSNPPSFGFDYLGWCFLALTNVSEEKENNLQKFLLESPNVSYFVSVGGKWDYFVEIVARDAEDFNKIVKNIRWKFSDMIKEEETVSLLQEHKLNYFPFADLLDNSKLEKFYSKYYKNAKWEPKTGW